MELVKQVDNTLGLMREAMLGNDWEAGAKQHQAEYLAWCETRRAGAQPDTPLGQWYVTHVLMPKLTNAMLYGNPKQDMPEPDNAAPPMPTGTAAGAAPEKPRRTRAPEQQRERGRSMEPRRRTRSRGQSGDSQKPIAPSHWSHLAQ